MHKFITIIIAIIMAMPQGAFALRPALLKNSPALSEIKRAGLRPMASAAEIFLKKADIHYNFIGCFEDKKDRDALISLIETSNLLEYTFEKIFNIKIAKVDIDNIDIKYWGSGDYREAYLVEVTTKDGKKKDIILKIGISPDAEIGLHQIMGYFINPIEEALEVGGIWQLEDGRVVLTEEYSDGDLYYDCLHKFRNGEMLKDRLDEIELALIITCIKFWDDTGGIFIVDPTKLQFVIVNGDAVGTSSAKPIIKIIDTGSVMVSEEVGCRIPNDGTVELLSKKTAKPIDIKDCVEKTNPYDFVRRLIGYLELRLDEEKIQRDSLRRAMPKLKVYQIDMILKYMGVHIDDIQYRYFSSLGKDYHFPRITIIKGILEALGPAKGHRFLKAAVSADEELRRLYTNMESDPTNVNYDAIAAIQGAA